MAVLALAFLIVYTLFSLQLEVSLRSRRDEFVCALIQGKSRRLDHRCSTDLLLLGKTIPDKRKLNESVLEGAEEREGESAPFSNTIFVPKVRNSLLAVDSINKSRSLLPLHLHY